MVLYGVHYRQVNSPAMDRHSILLMSGQFKVPGQYQWFALLYYSHGLTTDTAEKQLQSLKAGVVNDVHI